MYRGYKGRYSRHISFYIFLRFLQYTENFIELVRPVVYLTIYVGKVSQCIESLSSCPYRSSIDLNRLPGCLDCPARYLDNPYSCLDTRTCPHERIKRVSNRVMYCECFVWTNENRPTSVMRNVR